MVLSDADSLGSTDDVVTGRDTLLQGLAAHLFLRALGIRRALVLGNHGAASPVVGISAVAVKTLTESLVVAGPALRVGRAREELADGGAA